MAAKQPISGFLNDLSAKDFTYQQIEVASNRAAHVLKGLGIGKGDRVSIFLPKSPELVDCYFGILKNEAVACILFSTFGESALYDRLSDSQTKIVITKHSLLKRIQKTREKLDKLEAILVTDINDHQDDFVRSLPKMMAEAGG